MKKLLLIILFIPAFLLAQEPLKSDTTRTDSLDFKIKSNYDTLSYAEEYKRDYWRTFFGGRFGINQFRMRIDENTVDRQGPNGLPILDAKGNILKNILVNNPQYSTGFNAAFFFRFVRGSFFLQPELAFSTKAGKFDVLEKDGSLFKRVNASIQAIETPLLMGIRTRKSRFYFGPTASFGFGMNKELKSTLANYLESNILNNRFFNRPIMNFQFGVAYELNGLFIDIRFEKGLKSYTVQKLGPANSPQSFNLQADGIFLTLGMLGN